MNMPPMRNRRNVAIRYPPNVNVIGSAVHGMALHECPSDVEPTGPEPWGDKASMGATAETNNHVMYGAALQRPRTRREP